MFLSYRSWKYIILRFTVLYLLSFVSVIGDFTFGCSDENGNLKKNICKHAICDKITCVRGQLVPGSGWCGCCNVCLQYLEEYEICQFHQSPFAPIKRKCLPGLICDEKFKICRRKTKDSKCFNAQVAYDNANETQRVIMFRPECDENGLFASKQCRGTMCYCVNRDGEEIEFRRILRPASHQMTCECVIAHYEGQKHLRCLPNGNYNLLQCKGSFCYCIDDQQQQIGNPVYKYFISTLPCYDKETFKEHLSPCQQQFQELRDRIDAAKVKGIKLIGDDQPNCLPDGTFNAKQCRGSECFCVSRIGKFIPNYRQQKLQALQDKMKCICASEKTDASDGLAVSIGYSCHSTAGNFEKRQCLGPECFCVEPIYGYRLKESVNIDDVQNLNCD